MPLAHPLKRHQSAIVVLFTLLTILPVSAGVLYTEKELWAVGNLWKEVQCRWDAEQLRYNNRLKEIDASPMSQKHKDFYRQKEAKLHRAESQVLAAKRNQVHNVLIDEANARAGRGKQAVSDRIEASLGTKIDDPAHSGMKSDLDAQGGTRTAQKVKETLSDMGLDDLKVSNNAGTLEIQGDFDLTIHKGGVKADVGTEFHHIKNQVDARNHEIFMSERMRNRAEGSKQAGTDYVEVQDHMKKASDGHTSSNKQLVENPDNMQTMVKSTNKTLDMGDVSDDELQKILKRNGIDDTPEGFRKKLKQIKERRTKIKDPAEAGRIREASKDIMTQAEKKTYARAKDELKAKKQQLDTAEANLKKVKQMKDTPATAERRKKLQSDLENKAKRIREELIDSKSKMQATKAANDEFRAKPKKQKMAAEPSTGKTNATSDPHTSGKTKPRKVDIADAPDIKTKIKSKALKAVDGFGNIMDIADIGNACKKLQDYQEGKAELKDVVRTVVDMTPVGTVIGTSEKIATSGVDYYKSSQSIKDANESNMTAYLTQWELRFRKADMSKEEAKQYVADAILSGNLEVLEAKAAELRAKGKTIKSPKLVIEDGPAPDGGSWYMWENTKELGVGMYEGAKTGVTYIVTAPYRTVSAWGEGELKEATLDYNSKTAESEIKTRLFRSLKKGGIDSKRALKAVQDGGSYLKTISAEARKNYQAARVEKERIEQERMAFQQRVDGCLKKITDLRFMPLSLQSDPSSPIPIPKGTSPEEGIELTVAFDDSLISAVERIRAEITSITGQTPTISATYRCSLKSAKMTDSGKWTINLPTVPDTYPVGLMAEIRITGLTGDFTAMTRTIRRVIRGSITLKQGTESIALSKESYQFYEGDYEEITATVTGQQDGVDYYYQWKTGNSSTITQTPVFRYSAEAVKTDTITVVLGDRLTGSFLAEDKATINISNLKGTKVIINDRGSPEKPQVWKRFTCKDVQAYTRKEARAKASEVNRYYREQRARGDYIEGEAWDTNIYQIYGLQHGPYTEYDYDTGTMLDQTGHYRNGKKHGKWIRYETRRQQSLGSITEITHYKDGKKDGNSKHFIDGWLYADTNWKNDKEHGVCKYFNNRLPGKMESCITYNEGKRLSGFRWIYNGMAGMDFEQKRPRLGKNYAKTKYGTDRTDQPTERFTIWLD